MNQPTNSGAAPVVAADFERAVRLLHTVLHGSPAAVVVGDGRVECVECSDLVELVGVALGVRVANELHPMPSAAGSWRAVFA